MEEKIEVNLKEEDIIKKGDIITKEDCKKIKLFDVIEYNDKYYHCSKTKIFDEKGKLCGILLNKKIILYENNKNNYKEEHKKYEIYKNSLLKKLNLNLSS